ncbi:MAG: hypothetical protein LPK14_00430 [Hymenobacteraceae bacterium]|nr:hypothetical protein [Hymenobacteraceae bacterium]
MRSIVLKFLYVIAKLQYPSYQKDLCYYVRDNYYSRINQYRYLTRDFIFKKRYKTIEYHGEFQQELTFILPFAYWHHLNKTLDKTIGCINTKEFYFFSPDHEERFDKREWTYNYNTYEIPNMTHSPTFSFRKWAPVPFKKHYRNDLFVYDKPILIIANKYNIEWDQQPLNYLDLPTLDRIISRYKQRYQIIYNRPSSDQIISDNSKILDLKEHQWLKETHPEVLLMCDLYAEYRKHVSSFNHLQLMVYANSCHFVSVHGGTAALASYFGGTNVIYSRSGIEHDFDEFNKLFPALSGARILVAKSQEELLQHLKSAY